MTSTACTRCHQHSEMQPISGRICSSIIVCNNTALGTNCYTTLRPAMKVADKVFSAKSRKYHGGKKGEKGEQIRNLFNQRQLSQREINNDALLRMSGSKLAHWLLKSPEISELRVSTWEEQSRQTQTEPLYGGVSSQTNVLMHIQSPWGFFDVSAVQDVYCLPPGYPCMVSWAAVIPVISSVISRLLVWSRARDYMYGVYQSICQWNGAEACVDLET